MMTAYEVMSDLLESAGGFDALGEEPEWQDFYSETFEYMYNRGWQSVEIYDAWEKLLNTA